MEANLKVHGQWINWCRWLDSKFERVLANQEEIDRRQAVVERKLEAEGLIRRYDFDAEEEERAKERELWLEEKEEEKNIRKESRDTVRHTVRAEVEDSKDAKGLNL